MADDQNRFAPIFAKFDADAKRLLEAIQFRSEQLGNVPEPEGATEPPAPNMLQAPSGQQGQFG